MAEHPAAPEQRTIDVDVHELDTSGKRTVTGFAAVYNRESEDLGGFRERIAPGAFASVLGGDVRCLLNHNPDKVLGRTKAGTLRLEDEARGLRFECDLPESQAHIRESVERGDIDGASFRFVVGADEWEGDVRTVTEVRTLTDVSIATNPAYPDTSIELRSKPSSEPAPGLRVRDRRTARGGKRGLMDEFRSAGFPGERATIPFIDAEGRAVTLDTGSTSIEQVNQQDRVSAALGFDERWVFGAVPRVGVDEGVTAVNVVRQSDRTLATAANVIRDIDATSEKPETESELAIEVTPLKQVATKQSGIPNVYLEQSAVASIVENDLRLAVNGGLDKLVLDVLAGAGFQAPGTDKLLVSIRKAMTTIAASGYSADTLVLTPANAEALDTMVTASGTEDYVFGPGSPAGGIYGLRKVVSKSAPAPVLFDSSAVGRLYASPISLARFEESAGATNTSLIRLELHALFAAERIAAAVRIAAS